MPAVEATPALLEIRLFGQPEVCVDGRKWGSVLSKRAMWVLAILALRAGKPIDRQSLAGMVWPDSTDDASLHNLRQTLAILRKVLGVSREFIRTVSPRSLYIDPSAVWVDALEFDRLCADGSAASLEKAVELYRDALLTGCDEPFVTAWRDARTSMFLDISERLAQHHANAQNHQSAARVLRRLLAEDPYRESACRSSMKALAASGDVPGALETCRDFRQRLRRELRTDISTETKGLYAKLRRGAAETPTQKRRIPLPLTALVGRETEIRDVCSLLNRCRLVTLTGAGGVGKTRLALAVAEELGQKFLDGAWFVDLAPLHDPNTVPSAIARALEIAEDTSRPVTETIERKLEGRELLLVIDNCEHVTEAVAEVLEHLLSSVQGLVVLATSRQSIGVSGEHLWRVPSLTVPDSASPEAILNSDAVRLFIERAGIDDKYCAEQTSAIASICRRLDGLPLAIELAAARTNVLTPREIESRLDDRFALLTSGGKALARHQTLQASMEWSWELLSEEAQMTLMSASVFRGGCTLEAVDAVVGLPTLDLIASLADRSLVIVQKNNAVNRFHLLETVRQFAEKQAQSKGLWQSIRDRHFTYFLEYSEFGRARMNEGEDVKWFENFEAEHDNLRAALEYGTAQGSREEVLRLTIALGRFWDTCGHVNEGRNRLESALSYDTPGLSDGVRASAHVCAGWMATVQRDSAAAINHYKSALPVSRALKDLTGIAKILTCLGTAYQFGGDYENASAAFSEAIELSKHLQWRSGLAVNLCNYAEASFMFGKLDAAREFINRSLAELANIPDNPECIGQILCVRSYVDSYEGNHDSARESVLKALGLFISNKFLVNIPGALQQLSIVEGRLENWDRCAILAGACENLSESKAAPLVSFLSSTYHEVLSLVKSKMGSVPFDNAHRVGRGLSIDAAVSYAISE